MPDLGTTSLPVLGDIANLTLIIWAVTGLVAGLLFSGRGFIGLIFGIIGGLLGGAAFQYLATNPSAEEPMFSLGSVLTFVPADYLGYAVAVVSALIGAIVFSILVRILIRAA